MGRRLDGGRLNTSEAFFSNRRELAAWQGMTDAEGAFNTIKSREAGRLDAAYFAHAQAEFLAGLHRWAVDWVEAWQEGD